MSFMEKYSNPSSMQNGFRTESPTEFAILDIVSSCYENINDTLYFGLIMIALKKILIQLLIPSCSKTLNITVFMATF